MKEIDNPLRDYEEYFKDTHEGLSRDFFESLLQHSKVDKQENAALVAEIQRLSKSHADGSSTRGKWKLIRLVLIILAMAPLIGFFEGYLMALIMSPISIGAILWLVKKVNPKIRHLNALLNEVAQQQEQKTAEAWNQMVPLNELYTWDIASRLFQRAFPQVQFDRHLSNKRLVDLQSNYGLFFQILTMINPSCSLKVVPIVTTHLFSFVPNNTG